MKPKNILKGLAGFLLAGTLMGCVEKHFPKDLIDGSKSLDEYSWLKVPYEDGTVWRGYMGENLRRTTQNRNGYYRLVRERNQITGKWENLNLKFIYLPDTDGSNTVRVNGRPALVDE